MAHTNLQVRHFITSSLNTSCIELSSLNRRRKAAYQTQCIKNEMEYYISLSGVNSLSSPFFLNIISILGSQPSVC